MVVPPLREPFVVIDKPLGHGEQRGVLGLAGHPQQARPPRFLVVLWHRQPVSFEQRDEPVPDRRLVEPAREPFELGG